MESLHDEVRGLGDDGVETLTEEIRGDLVTGEELVPTDALIDQLRRLSTDGTAQSG